MVPDLRGYGRSSKPGTSIDHINYAKSTMAADLMQVMVAFGFKRFQAMGHDRGARVPQAMLMEHPDAVTRGIVLDVIPTDLMYAKMDAHLAEKYFWWLFRGAALRRGGRPPSDVALTFSGREVSPGRALRRLIGTLKRTEPQIVWASHFSEESFPRQALVDCSSLEWLSIGFAGVDRMVPWDDNKLVVTNASGRLFSAGAGTGLTLRPQSVAKYMHI